MLSFRRIDTMTIKSGAVSTYLSDDRGFMISISRSGVVLSGTLPAITDPDEIATLSIFISKAFLQYQHLEPNNIGPDVRNNLLREDQIDLLLFTPK